jgi:hypothetical protein
MVDVDEPLMGGGFKTVRRAQQIPGEVRINGYSQPNKKVPPAATPGAFALTHHVPKAFWEKWLQDNKGHPYVEKGLIFAAGSTGYVTQKAREREELRSGMEPINPDRPPMAAVQTYQKDAA